MERVLLARRARHQAAASVNTPAITIAALIKRLTSPITVAKTKDVARMVPLFPAIITGKAIIRLRSGDNSANFNPGIGTARYKR